MTSSSRPPHAQRDPATDRTARATTVGAPVLRALIEQGPAAVVCDDAGRVRLHNRAADALFPLLGDVPEFTPGSIPAWLSEAQAEGAATAQGPVGDREIRAVRQELPDGLTAWLLTDVTGEYTARRRLADERERTRFLANASARLLASLNQRRCLRATAELAAEQLADAAVVVTPAHRRRVTITTALSDGTIEERTVPVDTDEVPGLSDALAGFPPVPSRWVDPVLAPQWLLPSGFGTLGSLVVTPLPGNGVPAGALILLRSEKTQVFTEDEEIFVRIFVARAGAAISAAALYAEQSETTALLQESLLPPDIDCVDGVDLAGSYRPSQAARRIGGDFYDVHPAAGAGRRHTPDTAGETFLVLGDVCGKGTGAAILTGKIRHTLSALRHVESRHDRLLQLLNDTLLEDGGEARFATMVLAGATPLDGGRVGLRLTSAGHPPPLIIRGDGRVEEAGTRGTLIGALHSINSTTWSTVLEPGETCLLYSDGVTEARGGPAGTEMFGDRRLREALGECARMPASAVVERVEMLTGQWLGSNEHDDIALLAVTAPRGPSPAGPEGAGPAGHSGRAGDSGWAG